MNKGHGQNKKNKIYIIIYSDADEAHDIEQQ